MSADDMQYNTGAASNDEIEITEEIRDRYAQLKGMEANGELSENDREELDRLRPYFENANN